VRSQNFTHITTSDFSCCFSPPELLDGGESAVRREGKHQLGPARSECGAYSMTGISISIKQTSKGLDPSAPSLLMRSSACWPS
jgi:hypothetical protein